MWVPITSSAIEAVYYSKRDGVLYVRFPSGKQWGYEVAESEYHAMMHASSKGSYFRANIKKVAEQREYSSAEMDQVFAADARTAQLSRKPRRTEASARMWQELTAEYGLRPMF